MNFKTSFKVILLLWGTMTLAACGGGSGDGGGDNQTPANRVTLSGMLTAPGGATARPADANTALRAVSGATVSVFLIDKDGNPVGNAIATATTTSTGSYTVDLPADVTLDDKMIVRANINDTETLSALVVATKDNPVTDIDPVTEYVFQKIKADPDLALEILEPAKVVEMITIVKDIITASDLDLEQEPNLDSVWVALATTEADTSISEAITAINTAALGKFDTSLWDKAVYQ